MSEYGEFNIVIKRKEDKSYSANLTTNCNGRNMGGEGSFDLSKIPNEWLGDIAQAQEVGGIPVVRRIPPGKGPVELLGKALYEMLFSVPIAMQWGACDGCRPIRIRLDLSAVPELAALPWECLRLPDSTSIGLNPEVTLVRFLDTTEAIQPLKIDPPIRILVIASMPKEFAELDLNAEVLKMKKVLHDLAGTFVSVEMLAPPTLANLEKRLKEASAAKEPFHIIHFLGHATSKPEGSLLFENEYQSAVPVDAETFATTLIPYKKDLRLLVLNACETGRGTNTNVYTSVAARAIQLGIPAAIAMQYKITDGAAKVFSETLYNELANNAPLESAVDSGRRKIRDAQKEADARKPPELKLPFEEWSTPMLYLRSNSGALFDIKRPRAPKDMAPEFKMIKEGFENCAMVVFLGLEANLPGRPLRNPWEPDGKSFPTSIELRGYLGKRHGIVDTSSLPGLAQYVRAKGETLELYLVPAFSNTSDPTWLYDVLARLARNVTASLPSGPDFQVDPDHASLLFVTTTYDKALEAAFARVGITEYHTYRYGSRNGGKGFLHEYKKDGKIVPEIPDSNEASKPFLSRSDRSPVILKLPGEVSFEPSTYAITEDDFVEFAQTSSSTQLPSNILTQINTSRHLYLGYDIQNWTLRMLLDWLCKKPKWASQSYTAVPESDTSVPIWKTKGVQPSKTDLGDFVAGLEKYVVDEIPFVDKNREEGI